MTNRWRAGHKWGLFISRVKNQEIILKVFFRCVFLTKVPIGQPVSRGQCEGIQELEWWKHWPLSKTSPRTTQWTTLLLSGLKYIQIEKKNILAFTITFGRHVGYCHLSDPFLPRKKLPSGLAGSRVGKISVQESGKFSLFSYRVYCSLFYLSVLPLSFVFSVQCTALTVST